MDTETGSSEEKDFGYKRLAMVMMIPDVLTLLLLMNNSTKTKAGETMEKVQIIKRYLYEGLETDEMRNPNDDTGFLIRYCEQMYKDCSIARETLEWIRPWIDDAYSERQIENGKQLMDLCVGKIDEALSKMSTYPNEK